MRVLFSFLIMPLSVLFILLFLGIAFSLYNKKRTSVYLYLLVLAWGFVISTSCFTQFAASYLENQNRICFQVPDSIRNQEINILVLGGGHVDDENLTALNQLGCNALGRLNEGIRLFKQHSKARLVLSGWGAGQKSSQAEVLRNAARDLGIPDSSMHILPEPWNTKDEARVFKAVIGTNAPFILVTDAIHMPRAIYHFRNAGMNPVPAPTNFSIKKGSKSKSGHCLIPSAQNILTAEKLIHEYAGLLWAKMGGN